MYQNRDSYRDKSKYQIKTNSSINQEGLNIASLMTWQKNFNGIIGRLDLSKIRLGHNNDVSSMLTKEFFLVCVVNFWPSKRK
jgi:hypothetical protein